MEIGAIGRTDMNAPVTTQSASQDWLPNDRQAVAAVQWLNQAEWLGQDRELRYRHDPKTNKLVIQIFDNQTGDVVDQIPPESLVRLVSELQAELKTKDS